jgi:hypothetical protein
MATRKSLEESAEVSEVRERANIELEPGFAEYEPPAWRKGAIGVTAFDSAQSEDDVLVVWLPREQIGAVRRQSLVRIRTENDKSFLGIVAAGPFHEPDGVPATASAVHGAMFLPNFHGWVEVELLAEEVGGEIVPPLQRPLPNSAVFVLDSAQTQQVLHCDGSIGLGRLLGDPRVTVGIPADRKDVLPRHVAVLGTTGGGKSMTVGRFMHEAKQAGCAVVVLDVEGEYVEIDHQTSDGPILRLLERLKQEPVGIQSSLYHLVGRETANPAHPRKKTFGIQLSSLSPYVVEEFLELSEAQSTRFWRAYEVAKRVLRETRTFPSSSEEQRQELDLDPFEEGWPKLTLGLLIGVTSACLGAVQKKQTAEWELQGNSLLVRNLDVLNRTIHAEQIPPDERSWKALLGKLWRLYRLKVFDQPQGSDLPYADLVHSGNVSILDLSDVSSPVLGNLVIADVLRQLMEAQERAYDDAVKQNRKPTPVIVIVEEAHTFLHRRRITKMEATFEQLSLIARRGRKRWLSLMFITQSPEHLPSEVLGLVNNLIVHKLSPDVAKGLSGAVSGIDSSLWKRVATLAPGQALVHCAHMARPLLIAVDPAPCKLRMVN